MTRPVIATLAILACSNVNRPSAVPEPSALLTHSDLDSIVRAGVQNALRSNLEDPALLSALFHRLAQLADTGSGNRLVAYCVSIGAKPPGDSVSDPSYALLEQLNTLPLPVRPQSACRVRPRTSGRMTVIDTATGGKAVQLRLLTLNMYDTTAYTGEMVWYIGPLWAAGWICEATKHEGQWRVDQCRMEWIS
jgi:hypothetical protein